jgi:inhibitor of KinA
MSMTGIFPLDSPCGWHLIGRSRIPLWDGRPGVGALLTPGDQVNFIPVSLREYEDLFAKVVDGTLEVVPRANAKQPAKKKEAVGVTV